uniref:Fibronectin type III domain-containing protein n=1 Tax=uncultured bacterium Contig1770 TaxID=1393510 RepID=W0FN99_9BACT|nr:hypothetical protein [uncultured bacterium Contig1770]
MGYYEHVLTRILGPNFKCSWKASYSGNPKTIWQYHTNGHNIRDGRDTVIIWSPKKAQKAPASTSGSVGSDALPNTVIDGSKFWPNTNWVCPSVNMQLGLDAVGHSVAWWRAETPAAPVITLTPSDSNRTQTWEIDSDPKTVRQKDNNYWTHCRYWAQIAQHGERWADVPDWATTGWTQQFEPSDSESSRTWVHTAADPAPETPYAVRVVARNEGPAGESAVAYGAEHVFARPNQPTLAAGVRDGSKVTLAVAPNSDWWHPVDHVTVERQVAPVLNPAGSWSEVYDEDVSTDSLRACIDADADRLQGLAEDEAAWYRVRVWHDFEANSAQAYAARAVLVGKPSAPSVTAEYQDATNTIAAEVEVNSEMSVETWLRVMAGTDVVVDWMRWSPTSETAETICAPDGTPIEFDPTLTYRVHVQNRTVGKTLASGEIVDYGDELRSDEATSGRVSSESQAQVIGASLSAVTIDSVSLNADGTGVTIAYHWGTDDLGNVEVTDIGTSIEWTDASGGWISTTEPSQHKAADGSGKSGIVSVDGLTEGTLYHIRLRRYVTVDSQDGYGPEAEVTVVPQSTPSQPVLSAPGSVKAGAGIAYAWTFVDSGDSAQTAAELMVGDDVYPISGAQGAYVLQTSESQAGATVSARVRVSTGGGWSEWSDARSTSIAAPPTCTAALAGAIVTTATTTQEFEGDGEAASFELACAVISVTSVTVDGTAATWTLSDQVVTLASAPADGAVVAIEYEHAPSAHGGAILSAMPLSLDLGGTGDLWRVSVTCAHQARQVEPGGSTTHAQGDAIAHIEMGGSGVVPCQPIMGGGYDVEVVCVDTSTGLESEPVTLGFSAMWASPAVAPTATVEIVDGQAVITPASASQAEGETCRIWRSTADGAALCREDAEWGLPYVDRVPPYGDACAYVVEAVTADGDHAWSDVAYELPGAQVTIDWATGSVELPYNVELRSNWEKGFERREHMDGSRTGFWLRGVDRDYPVSVDVVRSDAATLAALSELARHDGICFVRARGCVAFPAQVDVSMSTSFDKMAVPVDLSISEVDDDGTWTLTAESEEVV